MIIIIAGSYKQYTQYIADYHLNPETHRYVSSTEKLLGFQPAACDGYMLVGTLYENPLAGELIDLLESRGIRRIQT